jgi:hypothetical protein
MTDVIIRCILGAVALGALLAVGILVLCAFSGLLFQYEVCRSYLRKAAFLFMRIPLGHGEWGIVALCPLPVILKSLDYPWDYHGETRAKEAVAKMKDDRNLINAAEL